MNRKPIVSWLLLGLLVTVFACQPGQDADQTGKTNHLVNSSSPYLLQHAHNPVDWYPWGEEALQKAKQENKLLIVSIGYAACHWCHVMERESFSDTSVAQWMNDHFISIKVDREERPDIDQIYMEASQLMTGHGGWPLNAIALPDGRPVFAGTYFEKEDWLELLRRIADKYQNDPAQFAQVAQQVTQGIQQEGIVAVAADTTPFSQADLSQLYANFSAQLDMSLGGLKGAPKFPMPINSAFLLRYYFHTQSPEAKEALEIALQKMAEGGIYDQLGGGFSRYSTDEKWFAPHFEKMLYDNAQLVSLYAQAYRSDQKPLYKKVVYETLAFVERELTSPEGAFYTSLNADSEGEEGTFYTWSKEEVTKVLGDDAEVFNQYFGISEKGNWEEGKNILSQQITTDKLAVELAMDEQALRQNIGAAKKQLFQEREKRERPSLDDKVLVSWNALMISGYTEAYRSFEEERFLNAALKNASFLKSQMMQADGKLFRNYKSGNASISAFLDDYANLIKAFTDLYQVTFDEQWLLEAEQLTDYALAHFYSSSNGFFYYTGDDDPTLIARKIDRQDNVMPASNSQMARNLFHLGTLLYREEYKEKANAMLALMREDMLQHAAFHANWSLLLLDMLYPPYEVAILGPNAEGMRKQLARAYFPHALLLGGNAEGSLKLLKDKLVEGETYIYVCQDKVCKRPARTVSEAVKQLDYRVKL